MKKIISVFLCVVLILSVFVVVPFSVSAKEIDKSASKLINGDYEYKILKDGTAEITSYSGSNSELSIPSSLDGYTVTSIGYKAFSYKSKIETLELPNTIKNIGDQAFYLCKNMKSITIPETVNYIGGSAFYSCRSLVSVVIPKSVKDINYSTFYECKDLKSIQILGNIETIGDQAFNYCESLTSIELPESVNDIKEGAFMFCKSLSSIIVDKENEFYTDGNSNCVIEKSSNELIFGGNKTIIPDYVTSIASYAFYGSDISSVSIPGNTKNINMFAFCECDNLTSVKIENGVESIFWGAFKNCDNLKSIIVPESVTTIENLAIGFYYNEEKGSDVQVDGFTIYGKKGSEAEVYANEKKLKFVEESKPSFVKGDANNDGKVSISDATCIQQYLAKLIDDDKIDLEAATMVGTKLSISDATHIQQFLAKLISEL